jgi:hypothetical protein
MLCTFFEMKTLIIGKKLSWSKSKGCQQKDHQPETKVHHNIIKKGVRADIVYHLIKFTEKVWDFYTITERQLQHH